MTAWALGAESLIYSLGVLLVPHPIATWQYVLPNETLFTHKRLKWQAPDFLLIRRRQEPFCVVGHFSGRNFLHFKTITLGCLPKCRHRHCEIYVVGKVRCPL
jgi:hypothetical protein